MSQTGQGQLFFQTEDEWVTPATGPHIVIPRSFSRGSLCCCCGQAPPLQPSRWISHSSQTGFAPMTFHPLMFQTLKPHIFTVGEQTYRNVKSLMEPVNQSIVVSGESGAGKVGGPPSTCQLHDWLGRQTGWAGAPGVCHSWSQRAALGGTWAEVRSQGSDPLFRQLCPDPGESLSSLSLHFLMGDSPNSESHLKLKSAVGGSSIALKITSEQYLALLADLSSSTCKMARRKDWHVAHGGLCVHVGAWWRAWHSAALLQSQGSNKEAACLPSLGCP